jgi:hypothetical protein
MRKAGEERRCRTCAHRIVERVEGRLVEMCYRQDPAISCAEERLSRQWPSCSDFGLFWAWGGLIVPPESQQDPTPISNQDDRADDTELTWLDLLKLVNRNTRDVAALAAIMWQAAANWQSGHVANELVFSPGINFGEIAEALDYHRIPVLPAAVAIARGALIQ